MTTIAMKISFQCQLFGTLMYVFFSSRYDCCVFLQRRNIVSREYSVRYRTKKPFLTKLAERALSVSTVWFYSMHKVSFLTRNWMGQCSKIYEAYINAKNQRYSEDFSWPNQDRAQRQCLIFQILKSKWAFLAHATWGPFIEQLLVFCFLLASLLVSLKTT